MELENLRTKLVLNDGDKIDDHLLCVICQELVQDPMECEDCQHLFCKICITDWMIKSNQCPYKCASIPPKIKIAHRFVRNTIQGLRYKCLNEAKGCLSINTLEQIEAHLKDCEFQQMNCKNQGCDYAGLKKGLKDHQIDCQFAEIDCKNCGQSLLKSKSLAHDCIMELTKKVNVLQGQNTDNIELIKQQFLKIKQLEEQLSGQQQQPIQIVQNQNQNQYQNYQNQYQNQSLYQNHNQSQFQDQNVYQSQFQNQQNQNQQNFNQSVRQPIAQGGQHKCTNNHNLSWGPGYTSTCNGCHQSLTIRYTCQPCNQGFCQNCKTPIIKNSNCPQGHKMEINKTLPYPLQCSICRAKLSVQGYYGDKSCNFQICNSCFKSNNS